MGESYDDAYPKTNPERRAGAPDSAGFSWWTTGLCGTLPHAGPRAGVGALSLAVTVGDENG